MVADPSDKPAPSSRWSIGYVGQWVALVVGLAGVLLPFGLLLLWLQIRSTFTNDAATAWYATSLPTRTFVVGHAIAALASTIASPFTLVMAVLVAIVAIASSMSLNRNSTNPETMRQMLITDLERNREQHGTPVSLYFVNWVGSKWTLATIGMWFAFQVIYIIYSVVTASDPVATFGTFFAVIGVTIGFMILLRDDADQRYGITTRRFWFLRGVLFAYVAIAMSALINPGLGDPSLPTISIQLGNEAAPIEGHFLAHADGYWHFFDAEGHLTSVADSDAVTVVIGPSD